MPPVHTGRHSFPPSPSITMTERLKRIHALVLTCWPDRRSWSCSMGNRVDQARISPACQGGPGSWL
jgi:hypothetical protein